MGRISFHRLAEGELNDAALYYERESPGLGISFLDEIEKYVEAIVRTPNAGTKVRGQVRRRLLHRFPCGILLLAAQQAAGADRCVPVQNLIDCLEAGDSLDEFLRSFPTVTREQAVAALEIAGEALDSIAHSH